MSASKGQRVEGRGPACGFLALCLSMAWVSVASEALHLTDGRLSLPGGLALMCVVVGVLAWCALDLVSPRSCDKAARFVPLVAGACCLLILVPVAPALDGPVAALYGVSCGLLLASSLTCYLRSGDSARRLFRIGLSAGIYTTAVYPVGLLYLVLSPSVPHEVLKAALFLALGLGSVALSFLRRRAPLSASAPEPLRHGRPGLLTIAMLLAVVAFAVFNHLLNSGILEQGGGTAEAPWLFFVNVLLRLPMGMLVGWLAGRGRWYYAIGLPLALMVVGCAVALLAGDGPVGDYAMLGVFNCGGAGIVMLIHVLGMQAALWRGGNALAASFGSLVHLGLVAFFNINTLGITPSFFAEALRIPLTFLVIVTSVPVFLLMMLFLVDQKLLAVAEGFFASHEERPPRHGRREKDGTEETEGAPSLPRGEAVTGQEAAAGQEAGTGQAPESAFSAFESEIATLLIAGLSKREIARKLHKPTADVDACLAAIHAKLRPANDRDGLVSSLAKEYGLTRREGDVLRELRHGRTNAEIAAELFVSEETVKSHMTRLMRKLPVDRRRDIPAWLDSRKR